MSSTFLELVRQVLAEIGLFPLPDTLQGAPQEVQRVVYFLEESIRQLARAHMWSFLRKEAVIEKQAPVVVPDCIVQKGLRSVIVPGVDPLLAGHMAVSGQGIAALTRLESIEGANNIILSQSSTKSMKTDLSFTQDTFSFPDEFETYVPNSMFSRCVNLLPKRVRGPLSLERFGSEVNLTKYNVHTISSFCFMFGGIRFDFAPYDSGPFVYNYISSATIYSAHDAITPVVPFPRTYTDDAHCVFPDDIVVLGTKARYLRATTLPGAQDMLAEYNVALRQAISNDTNGVVVPCGGSFGSQNTAYTAIVVAEGDS